MYVKLEKGKRLSREELEYYQEVTGVDVRELRSFWFPTTTVKRKPSRARWTAIGPIAIIVGGRLYPETTYGWRLGDVAYVEEGALDELY